MMLESHEKKTAALHLLAQMEGSRLKTSLTKVYPKTLSKTTAKL